MADITQGRFYSNKNYLNTFYALDLTLINHFAGYLFDDDTNRIVYASDAYAFRKRSDSNNGLLNLPFMNFRITDVVPGDRTWWNATGYTTGVYIPDYQTKVLYKPFDITYEATVWYHKDYDMRYAITEILYDADNKTILQPSVSIDGQDKDLAFPALLGYDNIQYDPEYKEQDWLERNKIHSIALPFTVSTMALQVNADITIPETLCFNFANSKEFEGTEYDEVYQFTINQLTEEVE